MNPKHIRLGIAYDNVGLGRGAPSSVFTLPLSMVTDSTAILGRKGSGKSTTARTLVEGMIKCHVPTVIIDPLDVWWGLRASADGTVGAGLDVVIFGGSHADLPLAEGSAAVIADLVVDKQVNAILVLDELKQAGQRRFVAAFVERLFERKRPQEFRTPLHVVVDEADVFAPQKPMTPESIASQSVVDRMVRHGRSRGIGSTVITQRSSVLSKDVLTQTEVLVAMQVSSPQDRKALKEWTDAKATDQEGAAFKASIASMERGEAWVWSPVLLKCFQRVKVDLPWTYDSSFTPTMNAKKPAPAKIKDLDLTAIKKDLETVVKQAEENDPRALKARVAKLQREVDGLRAEQAKALASQQVSTMQTGKLIEEASGRAVAAAIAVRDKLWRKAWDMEQRNIRAAFGGYPDFDAVDEGLPPEQHIGTIRIPAGAKANSRQVHASERDIPRHGTTMHERPGRTDIGSFHMGPRDRTPNDAETKATVKRVTAALLERGATSAPAGGSTTVGPAGYAGKPIRMAPADTMKPSQRKVLIVLAQHRVVHGDEPLSKPTLAVRSGYSLSGSFDTLLSSLRTAGWLAHGEFRITQAGIDALGHFDPPPALGREMREWWYQKITPSQRKVLVALEDGALGKHDLAAATGYAESGSFDTLLSSLRTLGLLVGGGRELMRLHEDLQDELP